jgi:AraC-like DNA-binding protein
LETTEKYLKYKDKIVFGKQWLPEFRRLPKTYFEDEACFIFVNQGEISVRAQTNYLNLDRNNAVLAKCLNYYFERNTCSEDVELIAVILYPSVVQEIFEFDLRNYDHNFNYNIRRLEVDRLLENFRDSISILIDNPDLADERIIATKLKEFVLLLSKAEDVSSHYEFLSAIFKPVDIDFKSTVLQNLYSSVSVGEIARLCHLSLSSFKRKFGETFGESPGKYFVRKKLEKAADLLRHDHLRVSDIAYDVGFESVATFNRNFNLIYGISPTKYRLSQSEKSLNQTE